MTIALVSIGTEITRGELVDENSAWLAGRLRELGHEVVEMATVDDDVARIGKTLERLSAAHDVVVATGGLGPTTDDLTTQSVARLLDVPLVRDAESLNRIGERFAARGRTMTESNAKQADFPEGAEVLPNACGTAPGFSVRIGAARAFFLPGVPFEMQEMFNEQVVARLPALPGHRTAIHLHAFGLPESEVNDRLAGLEAEYGVVLGYRAKFPEIEIKVMASGSEAAEVAIRCRAVATVVVERLGAGVVYGEGAQTLAGAVGALLTARGLTVSLAESCTGGLVSELFTREAGASAYYVGGVCCYANQVKSSVLGVGVDTLGDFGAVSEPVARQMAEGARRALGSDVALSLTGIAGPTGGTPEKPVGLVHFAVATREATLAYRRVLPGTRRQVQRAAAYVGLLLLREVLRSTP